MGHIDRCWDEHGTLLGRFGAGADHKIVIKIFRHGFNKVCQTTLASSILKLLTNISEEATYMDTYLLEKVTTCDTEIQVAGRGRTLISGYSKRCMSPIGLLQTGASVQWNSDGGDMCFGTCRFFVSGVFL